MKRHDLAVLAITCAAGTLISVALGHLAPADATNWLLFSLVLAVLA